MPSSGGQTCARSEEHTSELQSHDNLVCRLLLEKKRYNNAHLSSTDCLVEPAAASTSQVRAAASLRDGRVDGGRRVWWSVVVICVFFFLQTAPPPKLSLFPHRPPSPS